MELTNLVSFDGLVTIPVITANSGSKINGSDVTRYTAVSYARHFKPFGMGLADCSPMARKEDTGLTCMN